MRTSSSLSLTSRGHIRGEQVQWLGCLRHHYQQHTLEYPVYFPDVLLPIYLLISNSREAANDGLWIWLPATHLGEQTAFWAWLQPDLTPFLGNVGGPTVQGRSFSASIYFSLNLSLSLHSPIPAFQMKYYFLKGKYVEGDGRMRGWANRGRRHLFSNGKNGKFDVLLYSKTCVLHDTCMW